MVLKKTNKILCFEIIHPRCVIQLQYTFYSKKFFSYIHSVLLCCKGGHLAPISVFRCLFNDLNKDLMIA